MEVRSLLASTLSTAFAAQLSKLQSAVEKGPLTVLTSQVMSSTERITDNQSAEFVNGVSAAPGGANQTVVPPGVAFDPSNYINPRYWSQPDQSPKLNRRPIRLQPSPPTIKPIALDFNKQLTDEITYLKNNPGAGPYYIYGRKAKLLEYALSTYKTLLSRDWSVMKAYEL